MTYRFIVIFIFIIFNNFLISRNIFRKKDPSIPTIRAYWEKDPSNKYYLHNWYIREKPIFKQYDEEHVNKNKIPKDHILYRNSEIEYVQGQTLCDLLNNALKEIHQSNLKLKDFHILKKNDFNARTASGILILKFKDHPFVAKIFMETPNSFVKPFSKGWQPGALFYMAGGISRYLLGFSRIKNLNNVKKKISQDPFWSTQIDFPRKWFWIPEDTDWFIVEGDNIGSQNQFVKLPHTYVIIADAISADDNFSLFNAAQRKFALEISQFADNCIDPHINNFMKEKGTKKLVIIDTECFPIMSGISKNFKYDSYGSWVSKLGLKYVKDRFFCSKKYHIEQQKVNPYYSLD